MLPTQHSLSNNPSEVPILHKSGSTISQIPTYSSKHLETFLSSITTTLTSSMSPTYNVEAGQHPLTIQHQWERNRTNSSLGYIQDPTPTTYPNHNIASNPCYATYVKQPSQQSPPFPARVLSQHTFNLPYVSNTANLVYTTPHPSLPQNLQYAYPLSHHMGAINFPLYPGISQSKNQQSSTGFGENLSHTWQHKLAQPSCSLQLPVPKKDLNNTPDGIEQPWEAFLMKQEEDKNDDSCNLPSVPNLPNTTTGRKAPSNAPLPSAIPKPTPSYIQGRTPADHRCLAHSIILKKELYVNVDSQQLLEVNFEEQIPPPPSICTTPSLPDQELNDISISPLALPPSPYQTLSEQIQGLYTLEKLFTTTTNPIKKPTSPPPILLAETSILGFLKKDLQQALGNTYFPLFLGYPFNSKEGS